MDRNEFMELVYETFADEPDNILANGIIEAADAYVEYEIAQLSQEGTTKDATFDLISRQAAIDKVVKESQVDGAYGYMDTKSLIDLLGDLPSAQPEQKTGRWIQYDERFPWGHIYKCSKCGNYLDFSGVNAGRGSVNFCPNCGAKMEVAQDE